MSDAEKLAYLLERLAALRLHIFKFTGGGSTTEILLRTIDEAVEKVSA